MVLTHHGKMKMSEIQNWGKESGKSKLSRTGRGMSRGVILHFYFGQVWGS